MDVMFTGLSALGALLLIAGFVGCVMPVLPGPPLSFCGLFLLYGSQGWAATTFGLTTLLILGGAAILVTFLDLVTPIWGAKRFGASRAGILGSSSQMSQSLGPRLSGGWHSGSPPAPPPLSDESVSA